MSMFEPAMKLALRHEGGVLAYPKARAQVAEFGPAMRFLLQKKSIKTELLLPGDFGHDDEAAPKDIDFAELKGAGAENGIAIYRERFWDSHRYRLLPQQLANVVFDIAVDMGPAQAHRMLHQMIQAHGRSYDPDNWLSDATQQSIRTIIMRETEPGAIATLRGIRTGFCRQIAAAHADLQDHLQGWVNRALR